MSEHPRPAPATPRRRGTTATPLLEVDDVTIRFGGVVALDEVTSTSTRARSSA